MCEYIHNHSHALSCKHWWDICKYMFNGKQINSTIPPITVGDNVYNDNKDKAGAFNSFFTRISSLENHKQHLPPLPVTVPYNLDHIRF